MDSWSQTDRVKAASHHRPIERAGHSTQLGADVPEIGQILGQKCRHRAKFPTIQRQQPPKWYSRSIRTTRLDEACRLLAIIVAQAWLGFLAFSQQVNASVHRLYPPLRTPSSSCNNPKLDLCSKQSIPCKSAGSGHTTSGSDPRPSERGKAHQGTRGRKEQHGKRDDDRPGKRQDRGGPSKGVSLPAQPASPSKTTFPCPYRVRNPARFNYGKYPVCTHTFDFSALK